MYQYRLQIKWDYKKLKLQRSDSSVSAATGYGVGSRGSIPGRGKIILFSAADRPTLGLTQPSIH
jgi:hypothetical protein